MTTNNGLANGRSHKTLSTQLDRLDGILDGLADALNEAVTEAVKAAVTVSVRETVKSVLTEMLSNPELIARLRPAPVQTQATQEAKRGPGSWARVRSWLATAAIACRGVFSYLRQEAGRLCREGRAKVMAIWQCRAVLRRFRTQLLAALGVGLMLGALAWFAGPWLASLSSMVGGFTTTLAVQAGLWLRKVMGPAKQVA